jgi:hypothetical protein
VSDVATEMPLPLKESLKERHCLTLRPARVHRTATEGPIALRFMLSAFDGALNLFEKSLTADRVPYTGSSYVSVTSTVRILNFKNLIIINKVGVRFLYHPA